MPFLTGSYWQASRSPRYSLLFALPLLVAYQVLLVLAPGAGNGQTVRNGADVMLQSVFIALAGARGPLLFLLCLTGVGVWLVVRDLRVHPDLRKGVFGVMFSEATLYALCFGVVVGGLTTGLVHPRSLLLGPADAMPWSTRLMLSLGAGLYEELLFRVLLVGALAWAARRFLGWAARPAGVTAVVAGAAIFSLFHYIGPYGDRLELYSFVFRMLSGVFFSALYLLRGFGLTAWTHALYDTFLLVL